MLVSFNASALGSTQPCPFPPVHEVKKSSVSNFNPLVTISHHCHENPNMPYDVRIIWIQRVVTSFLDDSLGHFRKALILLKEPDMIYIMNLMPHVMKPSYIKDIFALYIVVVIL